jgi:hypothetical protein
LGGVAAGAIAAIAILAARPDLIAHFVPAETLQQIAAADIGAAPALAPTTADAETAPDAESPPPAPTPAPPRVPAQSLGDGVSVTLVSLADDPEGFIATLRFENTTNSDIGIAALRQNTSNSEFILTDGLGGACQPAAYRIGTLDSVFGSGARDMTDGARGFRMVPAGGSAQHTLMFERRRCETPITAPRDLSITGTFVLLQQQNTRIAAASFEHLAPRR